MVPDDPVALVVELVISAFILWVGGTQLLPALIG
jgi:hypothetical protein